MRGLQADCCRRLKDFAARTLAPFGPLPERDARPAARHTAGQRVLDASGNLKAVQKLFGRASIQTSGDVYSDWDIDQLAATMAEVFEGDS